tara:strand:+ start:394 stop:597 length:204 start_codon:yes stop_codon:yes gene_type:complete
MEEKIDFKNAKYIKDYVDPDKKTGLYTTISCTVNDRILSIPTIEGNRYYDEAMRQVEAGELTIEEAD